MSLCSSLATFLINSYCAEADLFINENIIKSSEGTTQGDPLAMPMCAIVTVPLIQRLNKDGKQVWYADDAASMGKVDQVRGWWDQLVKLRPGYGYYTNALNTWLVTKEEHLQMATDTFEGTGVKVTSHGRPYLGAQIWQQGIH